MGHLHLEHFVLTQYAHQEHRVIRHKIQIVILQTVHVEAFLHHHGVNFATEIQNYAHYVEFVQNAGLVHAFLVQQELVRVEAAEIQMNADRVVMDIVVPTPPDNSVRHLVFFQHKVALIDLDVQGFRMWINQEHLDCFVHAQMLLLTEMILAITL